MRAQDLLFATLDPTLRVVALPGGERVILSDTVGFISDLPTQLVAAFRATLEEVIEADIILHVRDMSHEDADAQAQDVGDVLADLGIDADDHGRLIEVWNKIDRLDEAGRTRVFNVAERRTGDDHPVPVSALTGEGIDALLDAIRQRLSRERVTLMLDLDPSDGEGLGWLYRHSEVLERRDGENGRVHLAVRVEPDRADGIERRFGAAAHGKGQAGQLISVRARRARTQRSNVPRSRPISATSWSGTMISVPEQCSASAIMRLSTRPKSSTASPSAA